MYSWTKKQWYFQSGWCLWFNWDFYITKDRFLETLFRKHLKMLLCAQSCPLLCDPMDCSPPASSVRGIFQARVLEWVASSFSRGIFPIQESNPHLHTRWILYLLSNLGSPSKMSWKVWKCKLLFCNLKMLHYSKQVQDVFSILKNGSIVHNSRLCGTLTWQNVVH